jgi:hypothetical protein
MTATMTPPPATSGRPRRRIALIVIGAVVVLVAVALVAILTGRGDEPAATPSTPSTQPSLPSVATSSGPSSTSPAADGQLADGCLGGPDPFAAILPAQTAATHDDLGAAAFARTFGRWSVTYPIDPDAPQVLGAIVTSGNPFQQSALDSLNQLARELQAQGYTESRVLADQGAYRISPVSTDTSVSLDLILYRQLTRSDGRTEEMRMATTILLERDTSGSWYISGTLPPLGADPFAPSPNAPWLSYEGAC